MSSKLQSLVMLQESQDVKDRKAYSKLELQILKSQVELLKKAAAKEQVSDGQAPSSPNLFVKVTYSSRSFGRPYLKCMHFGAADTGLTFSFSEDRSCAPSANHVCMPV
jgi:hypothetical protein